MGLGDTAPTKENPLEKNMEPDTECDMETGVISVTSEGRGVGRAHATATT